MYCTFCSTYKKGDCSCDIRRVAKAQGMTHGSFCEKCGQQYCWHIRPQDTIESLRDKVDMIDKTIVQWFQMRMEHTATIGRLKQEAGLEVRQSLREEEIIRKVRGMMNGGPASPDHIERIFREILNISREQQEEEDGDSLVRRAVR